MHAVGMAKQKRCLCAVLGITGFRPDFQACTYFTETHPVIFGWNESYVFMDMGDTTVILPSRVFFFLILFEKYFFLTAVDLW